MVTTLPRATNARCQEQHVYTAGWWEGEGYERYQKIGGSEYGCPDKAVVGNGYFGWGCTLVLVLCVYLCVCVLGRKSIVLRWLGSCLENVATISRFTGVRCLCVVFCFRGSQHSEWRRFWRGRRDRKWHRFWRC